MNYSTRIHNLPMDRGSAARSAFPIDYKYGHRDARLAAAEIAAEADAENARLRAHVRALRELAQNLADHLPSFHPLGPRVIATLANTAPQEPPAPEEAP